jgi:ketosteroid isomerase-like protein
MKIRLIVFVLISLGFNAIAADTDAKTEATHNELRALRDGLLDAMNKGDIERELTFLHTNVVITWHNAEVSRGREGVRAYYNRLTGGPGKMVEKFSTQLKVDELTILHGENTGISFGSSVEHFELAGGRAFDLNGRWTATLVKDGGKWLIASLHVSTNIFDNVILDMVKKRAVLAIVVVFAAGVAIGWFIGRGRKSRKPTSNPA